MLLTEDSAVHQKLATRLLLKLGGEVVVTSQSKDALIALEQQEPCHGGLRLVRGYTALKILFSFSSKVFELKGLTI